MTRLATTLKKFIEFFACAERAPTRFSNFTPQAQRALQLAKSEAVRLKVDYCGVEHLLLGLIQLGQGVAFNVLTRYERLNPHTFRSEIEESVGLGVDELPESRIPFTPRMKRVLENAAKEAKSLSHAYVGTEHLLLGILHEDAGVAAPILQKVGLRLDQVREEILRELDPNFILGEGDAKDHRTDV